jgi:16S rRNA (guanine527-N7)-methyltransferase
MSMPHDAAFGVAFGGAFGPADFQKSTGVSRETMARLETYAEILAKWQRRINLIGPKTLPDLWRRHMLDSAQLFPLLPPPATAGANRRLIDFGSGAGFPGLVLAAMGADEGLHADLVEVDQRKAVFLREAARAMDLSPNVTVHTERLEKMSPLRADCVTARALASVSDLLGYVQHVVGTGTPCLFLKGKRLEDELTAAKYAWYIEYRIAPSITDPAGAILTIEDFADVRSDSSLHDPP